MTPEARKTIWGAFLGFFVDMYDVYLPIIALTPALIYFQPKGLPAAAATTVFYVVFAVTLIGRPIGSFIFGHLGDKIGRRKTTMIAVTGFGLVTLLIALLPGYQAIGMAALVLLILLRLVDGIFLGGEYTAASPLAMECCPKPKRALYSAVIQAGYPIAYVAISLLVALIGYSLAVILPAFYSFVTLWMASFMPYKFTQIPLLALGGLLILLGAAMGPETKDVDIAEPATERAQVPGQVPEPAGGRRRMVTS